MTVVTHSNNATHICIHIYRLQLHENQIKHLEMNSEKEKSKQRTYKNKNA